MRPILVTVAVLVAGCKKPAGEDPRVACTAAVERAVEQTIARRRAALGSAADTASLGALAPSLTAALVELCAQDRWSAAVVSCFQHAPDVATCHDQLTPEQRARYTQQTMKLVMASRLERRGAGSGARVPGAGSGSSK